MMNIIFYCAWLDLMKMSGGRLFRLLDIFSVHLDCSLFVHVMLYRATCSLARFPQGDDDDGYSILTRFLHDVGVLAGFVRIAFAC
jgi:hypothetical protein